MAKYSDKNGKSKPAPKIQPPDFRFLNHELNTEDQAWIAAADTELELPDSLFDECVEQGYKFSLSQDSKNNCYVASLTDRAEGTAFENTCLTGRGSTPRRARISLAYRHIVLGVEGWGVFEGPNRAGARDFS